MWDDFVENCNGNDDYCDFYLLDEKYTQVADENIKYNNELVRNKKTSYEDYLFNNLKMVG